MDPFKQKALAEYGSKLLQSKLKYILAVYFAFIVFLLVFREYMVINAVGFYAIFIPTWSLLLILIIYGYIFFWKTIKYIVYASAFIGLCLLFTGNTLKAIFAFGPAAFIISLFVFFAVLFVVTLIGVGLIGGIICALFVSTFTHSDFLLLLAIIIGFVFSVMIAYSLYTRIILPFTFGFSSSIVAAYISSAFAILLFHPWGTGFFLPRLTNPYIYQGSLWNVVRIVFNYFKNFFECIWFHNALIFIISVIVGMITVLGANAEENKNKANNVKKT